MANSSSMANTEIMQAYFDNRTRNNRDINQNMLGNDNNKRSPDSAWMFPGLINPVLFPGFLPTPIPNQNNIFNPMFPPNMHKQFPDKNCIPQPFLQNNFPQNDVLTPQGNSNLTNLPPNQIKREETSFREQLMDNSVINYKFNDNASQNLNIPQNFFPQQQQQQQQNEVPNFQNNVVNNQNRIQTPCRERPTNDASRQITPSGTPVSDNFNVADAFLQAQKLYNMNFLNNSHKMQMAFAAQINYLSLLQDNKIYSNQQHRPPEHTKEDSNNQYQSAMEQSKANPLETLSEEHKIYSEEGESTTYTTLHKATENKNADKMSKGHSYPTRPNHLGSSFVPQTQFNNANHESSSDVSSPAQNSPYEGSSRTPSPHCAKTTNTCPQCHKSFSSSSALAKHKLIHSDERRFVCHICSRGFKRQDHLNGHMLTHRDKKPYECHFPECRKSYCDMRSLKRHYENNHSSPLGGATPGYTSENSPMYPTFTATASTANKPNTIHRPYLKTEPSEKMEPVIHMEPPRPSSAPLVPPEPRRIIRNRRSSSGEESYINLDPDMRRELDIRKKTILAEQEHLKNDRPISSSYPVHFSTAVTTVTESNYTRTKEYPHQYYRPYEHYAPSSSHSKIFSPDQAFQERNPRLPPPSVLPSTMPPHLNPRFPWHPQYPSRLTEHSMPYLLNSAGSTKQFRGYSPRVSSVYESRTSEHDVREQAVGTYLQMWASGHQGNYTPEQIFRSAQQKTDPTAIAVNAAREQADKKYQTTARDSYYGIQPTNAQWQSVLKNDSIPQDKNFTLNYYQNATSATQKRHYEEPHLTPTYVANESVSKPDENHNDNYVKYSPKHQYEKPVQLERPRTLEATGHQYNPALNYETSKYENFSKYEPPTLTVQTPDNKILSAVSPGKKRPRPGPIVIPPAMNNRSNLSTSPARTFQTMAKMAYTPPAMLSPQSIFFNPPAIPKTVVSATPTRYLLSTRRSTSIDQREPVQAAAVATEEGKPAELQEPKINVGPLFQAALPNLLDRGESQKDVHRASLMWIPLKAGAGKEAEVDSYLDMACSLGLYGGSNNKEYALHILQRTRGNIKEAVRLLLSRRHILRADDPNADYHYSGSVRWTAKERLTFRQAYRSKGKFFSLIQKEVETKTVFLCVEFYYFWKAMHPESFRARTRIVEVESDQDDEEVPPTPTAAVAPLSTLREPVFECDYPECRARFVSRQALNGHIRVHGGSFTKPADYRRAKPKSSPSTPGDHTVSPTKKKKTTQTSVIVNNNTEQPLQFQCKVCGRVFSKVKSRSAHMKTHVKRDENNKPIKKNAKHPPPSTTGNPPLNLPLYPSG